MWELNCYKLYKLLAIYKHAHDMFVFNEISPVRDEKTSFTNFLMAHDIATWWIRITTKNFFKTTDTLISLNNNNNFQSARRQGSVKRIRCLPLLIACQPCGVNPQATHTSPSAMDYVFFSLFYYYSIHPKWITNLTINITFYTKTKQNNNNNLIINHITLSSSFLKWPRIKIHKSIWNECHSRLSGPWPVRCPQLIGNAL